MITDEYIAGFFDGEGCITSQMIFQTGKYEKYPRVNVQLSIANTNRQTLEDISQKYGGSISKKGNRPQTVRECYSLCITGKENMSIFLNAILPYLRIKKDQAIIALEFIETIREENLGCVALNPEIHLIRKNIHDKLRLLKRVA